MPVKAILRGGLSSLPLAPVSNVELSALPGIIRRMKARLGAHRHARELWAADLCLAGAALRGGRGGNPSTGDSHDGRIDDLPGHPRPRPDEGRL